jgi:hypothetical protein
MTNYEKLTIQELLKLVNESMHHIHHDIFITHYQNILDPEKRQHLVYMAIHRINMYLATNVIKTDVYSFCLDELVDNNNRDALIELIEVSKSLTYTDIRNAWHNGLNEKFYKQKANKKFNERLNRICIVVRNETKNGFISLNGKSAQIKQNIKAATEFEAKTLEDIDFKAVLDFITPYFPNDELKVFFNSKMAERTQMKL